MNRKVKCYSAASREDVCKEADMKIIVHVKHYLLNGFRNAVVKTVHSDVITLTSPSISARFTIPRPYKIEVALNFEKIESFTRHLLKNYLSNSLH